MTNKFYAVQHSGEADNKIPGGQRDITAEDILLVNWK
jgi:hypothetical protein